MIIPSTTATKAGLRRSQRLHTPYRFVGIMGCALLSSGVLALGLEHPAQGQTISTATVTEILDSNQVYIQNQRAQVNGVAQRQQQVRTQAARAALRFNNGAVARLSHNSSLVVGQCAQLNRGTLLVNGSLNGCSTTTVAGVRGTLYTLEVTDDGQTIIQVFEGEVVVERQPETFEPIEELEPLPEDREEDGELESESPEAVDSSEDTPDNGGAAPKQSTVKPTENSSSTEDSSPTTLDSEDLNPETLDPEALDPEALDPETESSPREEFPETTEETSEETVDFTSDSSLRVVEGQQVIVDAENNEAVIAPLTAEDFVDLLEGPLISGFITELPGISDLRGVFQRLFPSIPLPFGLPSIPIPLPPIRFPF